MTRGDRDRGGVQGARSGGMTHHIQGPHLIPNVGREAMLVAEVIRRRPKAKSKPGSQVRAEKREKVEQRDKKRKKRRDSERSRSSSAPARKSRSRTQVRPEQDSPGDGEEEEDEAAAEEAHEGALPALDVNSEHEARRIEEERRQLQRLKEVQEKKRKQESERRKNLGGVFALSADDFDKEEDERAKRAQAQEARSEKQQLRHPTSRTSTRRDEKMQLDDGSPGSGFDKCWKNWDFTKAEDPAEVARQFMRVTAAKRRGYGARDGAREGARDERPERERRRSRSGSRSRGSRGSGGRSRSRR